MAALKAEIGRKGAQGLIEIDGGINQGNIRTVEEAGVGLAVAGSAVFGAADPAAAISALRGA